MDCSWLVDNDCNEESGSESDPDETQAELEARLYSIVHHSDLSQPLPPDLAKHYSIECEDDGKLVVALNDSLENIKSEEIKKVDNLVNKIETCDEASVDSKVECSRDKDDVFVFSGSNSNENFPRKFRYSQVNLDSDTTLKSNGTNVFSNSDINYSNLNYFKISQSFLNKKKVKRLKDLVIPPSFHTSESLNWKDTANESFISVGNDSTSSEEKDIIDQMVCVLKKANPHERRGNLYHLARQLFFHNRKLHRKLMRRKQSKAKITEKSLESSNEVDGESVCKSYNSNDNSWKQTESVKKHTNNFDGSISLNISPFKPLSTLVDLVSEDEIDSTNKTTETTAVKWKSLPKSELPTKWTKKMTKFYTKPSRSKMEVELDDIFENFKKNTSVDDWKLDPRDEMGKYQSQRTPLKGKYRNRRCPNCHHYGHLMHDCPSPWKTPTCFLCGLPYHTGYSCPNTICLKCGVNITNDSYECSSCYYNTFNYDTPCGICGQVTHRTEICPDLWRSYHATVEGDKKIPQHVTENKRKYCCNCATKGHFSHQCPFPSCEGEHISSFVTNYSASNCESGATEIVIPNRFSYIIEGEDADRFLQKLSNTTNAVIDVEEGQSNYRFTVRGTFEQCRKVKSEIEEYVNTRKRKRQEPYSKKKRRKIR